MALLDETYDGSNVPEGGNSFKALPAGDYKVLVIESEYKPTNNNTGMIAIFQLEVLSDHGTGRRIFAKFNLKNQSQQAEEIARREFDSFRTACGCGPVRDTADLHNKVLIVRLGVKKDADYGDDDGNINVIKAYKSLKKGDSNQQTVPAQHSTDHPAQTQAAQQEGSGVTPAWRR